MTAPSRHIPAISLALGIAVAGLLLCVVAFVTDAVPPTTAIVAAIACATIAVAALAARRHASTRPPPLTLAPRVAAIALVAQALLLRLADSTASRSLSLRVSILLAIAALGVGLLASLSIIALRLHARWAIAGLLAWTVGWVAIHADLGSLILSLLEGPALLAPDLRRQLDPELVPLLTTAGGLVIGAALVSSIRDSRFRHSAVLLLAGYAAFGVIAAVTMHRIELAADYPSIVALRGNRDLADTITALALAGVLWLYWRRAVASSLPRARTPDS